MLTKMHNKVFAYLDHTCMTLTENGSALA